VTADAEGPGYETFVRDLPDLPAGRDLVLVLRDLRPGRRKYLAQNVRARVTRAAQRPEGYWALRVRSAVGNELPGPWWVCVIEVLPSRLAGAPYSSFQVAVQALGEGSAEGVQSSDGRG
jgi:hypothetical protein